MDELFSPGVLNTDRELWRERPGDYYSDSIHVTQSGGIGINCGGYVIVLPLNEWHRRAMRAETVSERQQAIDQMALHTVCARCGHEDGRHAPYCPKTALPQNEGQK